MLMDGCEDEVLARTAFPKARRRQLRDTNPLERLNAEIKRRTDAGLRGGHDCEALWASHYPTRDAWRLSLTKTPARLYHSLQFAIFNRFSHERCCVS